MVFIESARLHARRGLTLRWTILFALAADLITLALYRLVWAAIYAGRPTLQDMTLADMSCYYALSLCVTALCSTRIDRDISRGLLDGSFTSLLLRPAHPLLLLASQKAGPALLRMLTNCLPLLLVCALALRLPPPSSPAAAALFAAGVTLAFWTKMSVDALAGLCAFYTRGAEGVTHAKDFVVAFLSGALVPLSFLPPGLAEAARLLPFAAVVDLPLQLYRRGLTPETARALALGALWCALLAAANQALLRAGLRRHAAFGG